MRFREITDNKGFRIWPPDWSGSSPPPIGEIGLLFDANIIHPAKKDEKPRLNIWIEYEGEKWLGVISIDHLSILERLHKILLKNIGKPINELGDLEVKEP
jgi:hypothetical protein